MHQLHDVDTALVVTWCRSAEPLLIGLLTWHGVRVATHVCEVSLTEKHAEEIIGSNFLTVEAAAESTLEAPSPA